MTTGFEKAGIILGVIAAFISIPKGVIDSWQAVDQTFFIKPEPKLRIERGDPLSLSYDPSQKTYTLSWDMILENDGNANESIESCTAYLGVPGDAGSRVTFKNPDVIFKDGGNQIQMNTPIQKDGGFRSIACETTPCYISDAMFDQHETQREFVIELSGRDQRPYPPLAFHFDLEPNVKKTLYDQAPKPLPFVGSKYD